MTKSWNILVISILFSTLAHAAPATLTYQGRILNTNGQPLEHSSVSFEFRITNPSGSCVIFREQKNGVDMTNSKGVFDTPIGEGTQIFPTDPQFTLTHAFSNASTLNCEGGATYSPIESDGRLLRVRFHDGSGWKTVSPDNVIRSVPFAAYSANATRLGGKEVSDLVLKTGIPTCAAGNVLTSSSAGVLICTPDTGGTAGIVNSITATAPISAVDNGGGVYTISATVGTTAGTLAAGNDSRFTNSRAPTGPASGDLTGNYPAPSIADDAVTTIKVLDAAITTAKIADANVTAGKFAAGTASGQVPRFNGTAWTFAKLNFGDLINAAGNSPWPSGSCALNQFITWVSVTDGFSCTSLNSSMVTTALGFTPVTNARVVSTGTAAATGLTGGGALTSDLNLAVNVGTGANQIPQLDSAGKLLSSILPSTITDAAWTAASGNVYRSTGNVGIGTITPETSLHIMGSAISAGTLGYQAAITSTASYNASPMAGVLFKNQYRSADTATAQMGGIGVGKENATDADYSSYMALYTRKNGSGLTERVRIDSSGNVGIGTTAPAVPLEIVGANQTTTSGYGELFVRTNNTQAQDIGGSIAFGGQDGTIPDRTFGIIAGRKENSTAGNYASYMTFYTRPNSTSMTERMRIDSSGNVGIGTNAPTTKLEVAGTIKATAFEGPLTATTNSSGAGSNSAPSYSFSGDPDTGFYNASSNNTISVTNGGTKTFDFTSLGLVSPTAGGANITTAAGTASLPTYSFAGDTDTGWWNPAANTLAASTGGTERIRIDSAGNIGVGTTAPLAALETVSSTAANGLISRSTAALGTASGGGLLMLPSLAPTAADQRLGVMGFGGYYSGTSMAFSAGVTGWSKEAFSTSGAGGYLTFETAPTGALARQERVRIDSSGNVGIGTASPNTSLHIYSSYANGIILERNGLINSGVEYKNTGGSMFAGIGTNLNFAVGTSSNLNAGSFQVTPAGNVGIGTASPTAVRTVNLDVNASGSTNGGAAIIATKRGTGLATASLLDSTGSKGFDINYNDTAGYAPGTDSFGIYDRTAAAYRLAITSAGNVGIGTAVPTSPLHVGFTNNNTTNPTSAAGIKIQNNDSTVGNMASVLFNEGTTSATSGASIAALFEEHDTTPATSLLIHTSNGTSFAERMRVTSAGNVGIGLTDPKNKLDVNGAVNSSGGYRMNTAWNGSAYTTLSTGFSGIMYTDVTSGGTHFATSPSSIAAGAVTTVPIVMSLSKEGRVGIGVTTPAVALETIGEIRASGTANGFATSDRAGGTDKMIMYLESGYLKFSDYGAGARMVIQRTTGRVGIGTGTPGYPLHVVGDTYTSGFFNSPNGSIQTSDLRFKRNIASIEDSLGKIISLRGVTYDWRKDEYPERQFTSRHQMGVIAQEVEKQFPEAVVTDESGFKSVNYPSLVAPLINSVKELYAQLLGTQSDVQALKKENSEVLRELASVKSENQNIKAENAEIKARLEKLEAALNSK